MNSTLAIDGGTPVRDTLLPYGRQSIDDGDIEAVVEALRSDWLTTGPKVSEFEQAFAQATGSQEAVAVSSGTAALHAMYYALGIGPGDEVIVPSMTFAATANAAVYLGAKPIFADCDSETLLMDPESVEALISKNTKAICTVDYAGQPSEYAALQSIADTHDIQLVSDSCHALGATYGDNTVGSLCTASAFSFHPVKPMTTGEGGMVTTDDASLARRMRIFRNHCITTDHRERHEKGSWFYEQVDLGYNYRITDIQCALGCNQLSHVSAWTSKRQEIAQMYSAAFSAIAQVTPLHHRDDRTHAYHLCAIQLDLDHLSVDRSQVFQALRAENIGVNVHYIPVHLHPYYQENFGTQPGNCPKTEQAYDRLLTIPIFPDMTENDVQDVVSAFQKVCIAYSV